MATEKKNKSTKLYEFRKKNYRSNSPHYIELNRLIKHGTKEDLINFGSERLLEGPAYDEFMEAVDTRFPEGDKAPRTVKDEAGDEVKDEDVEL